VTPLFKPMLAKEAELDKLRFPLLASPKLDGVRAVVRDGVVFPAPTSRFRMCMSRTSSSTWNTLTVS